MSLRFKKPVQRISRRSSHPVTVHPRGSLRRNLSEPIIFERIFYHGFHGFHGWKTRRSLSVRPLKSVVAFLWSRLATRCLCGGVFAALVWLALGAAQAQTTIYTLGTSALLVGSAAGSNSVVLGVAPATGAWTAGANTNWLHLGPAYQSGIGSTNVIFSYDANEGATRAGTLTIGDQTLNVTQAGSTYVAVGAVTTLVPSGVGGAGLAVDGVGNLYICGGGDHTIGEWTVAKNSVSTLVYVALFQPSSVAVDGGGNVYMAGMRGNAIKEWTAANSNVTTLVSSPYLNPDCVAVDGAGNVYFSSGGSPTPSAINEWMAANSIVSTLVSSDLTEPLGVAVDGAGNVYFADAGDGTINEWTAANSNVTTLVSSGMVAPWGLAVDGSGNVYTGDTIDSKIKKWTAANSTLTELVSSGLNVPYGVAVDGAGNVYILNAGNNAIKELPHAFVDPTPRLEGLAAGNDCLPPVLPPTENLLPPFAPSSDQSWLTITGVTNGVVSFSFTANTGSARTAHITLLGQSIPITQGLIGTPPNLSGAQMPGHGVLQFGFTNTPGASFTVVSTTNLSLPWSEWTVAGAATNTAPGAFQFTSQPTTNDAQRFYGVRSP